MDDPFAAVAALDGVPAAAAAARDALDGLLRQRVLRADPGAVAATVAVLDARASAALAGDGSLQGALRLAAAVPDLAGTWRRAPLQALARMHVLAAAGTATGELGRPRPDAEVVARLRQLAGLARATTRAPGVVVAAVVEGELLALRAFGSADGIVARAAARVVLVASGVDRAAVCPLSAGHLARRAEYTGLAAAYAGGGGAGVAAWVRHCALACTAAAEQALAEAEAVTGRS